VEIKGGRDSGKGIGLSASSGYILAAIAHSILCSTLQKKSSAQTSAVDEYKRCTGQCRKMPRCSTAVKQVGRFPVLLQSIGERLAYDRYCQVCIRRYR
jgi:hypothetical protein